MSESSPPDPAKEPLLLGKMDAARKLGLAMGTFDRLLGDCELPAPLIGGKRPLWHAEQLSLKGIKEWQLSNKQHAATGK